MANFRQMPMEREQVFLFPVSVDESIPADCDVRAISEAMDLLDWSGFECGYSEEGCPAYPPKVLAKILVYGYSKGIRSSRVLEDAVKNDKRYIWLAGGLRPDHSTIARLRKRRQAELKVAFQGTSRICEEAGLVVLHTTATDGSKVRARASARSLYDKKRLERERIAIEQILAEAEEVDRREDEIYGGGTAGQLPEELVDARKRKEKLEEIARRLEESGQKRVSATDPECRVMKTGEGLKPAYNVEMTVDSAYGVVVAADVTNNQNDAGELLPQLEQVQENMGCRPDVALADTGFCDEETLSKVDGTGTQVIMPPREQPQQKDRNNLFASRCFRRDEEGRDVLICPAGRELTFKREVRCSSGSYRVYTAADCRDCSFYGECVKGDGKKKGRSVQVSVVAEQKERLREFLGTEEGKGLYGLRKQIVEPVLGGMKSGKGFWRFLLDGCEGARSEWWLMCMAHNLGIYVRRRASAAAVVGTRAGTAAHAAACDVCAVAAEACTAVKAFVFAVYRLVRPMSLQLALLPASQSIHIPG